MAGRDEELHHLAEYDFAGRNEADIRGDWIEPLLRLLGYGLGTRHSILREESLRLDPPVRMIGSSRYDIDFVPTVFGRRLWMSRRNVHRSTCLATSISAKPGPTRPIRVPRFL